MADLKLKTGEALGDGLRRLAEEQLGAARAALESGELSEARQVHEARKAFKKTRAVLRLAREALGPGQESLERMVRDLGHALAAARDGEVLLATLDGLAEDGEFPEVRRRLEAKRGAGGAGDARATVLRGVRLAAAGLARWELGADAAAQVARGVKKAHRRAKQGMARAAEDPTPERLHEWRKRVKHCTYVATLLGDAWDAMGGAAARKLDKLGERLGEDRDLALLAAAVRGMKDLPPSKEAQKLLTRVERKREKLQRKAFERAEELLAGKPKKRRKTLRKAFAETPRAGATAAPAPRPVGGAAADAGR